MTQYPSIGSRLLIFLMGSECVILNLIQNPVYLSHKE